MSSPHYERPEIIPVPVDPEQMRLEALRRSAENGTGWSPHDIATRMGEVIPAEPEAREEITVAISRGRGPSRRGGRSVEEGGDSNFDEWTRHMREPVSEADKARGQAALESPAHLAARVVAEMAKARAIARKAGGDTRRELALMAADRDKRNRGKTA